MVVVVKVCVMLAIVWHTSAYTLKLCNKQSNVRYTLYYNNYHVNVNAYHCPVNETTKGCEGIGVSVPITKSNRPVLQECLVRAGKKGMLKLPFYYENSEGNSTKFNITLCSFTTKAKPIGNVIHLPPPFKTETTIQYSSGKYFDKALDVNIMWYLDHNCSIRETAYSGPVDVYTAEDYAIKYLVGKSSGSEFSVGLRSKVRVCKKDMWLTDEFGILASDSESIDVPASENPPQFSVKSLVLKICYLDTVTEELGQRSSHLEGLLYRMVLGGVGLCLVFVLVLVCSVNYFLLKKMQKRHCEPEIYYKFSGSPENDDRRKPVVRSPSYLLPRECLGNSLSNSDVPNNSQDLYAYADLNKARPLPLF